MRDWIAGRFIRFGLRLLGLPADRTFVVSAPGWPLGRFVGYAATLYTAPNPPGQFRFPVECKDPIEAAIDRRKDVLAALKSAGAGKWLVIPEPDGIHPTDLSGTHV